MDTKEKLKIILHEWAESVPPTICARQFDMSYLDGSEILSIIGARRAGKTYVCYQIIQELKKNKTIPKHNILYINFEDERLDPLNGDELTLLLDVYLESFEVDMTKKVYLFVDEIQNVENWAKWARRITDQNKNIKLIITGLDNNITSKLCNRVITTNVFPLSFAEYLSIQKISVNLKNIFKNQERFIIKKQFNKYLQTGGFPAAITSPSPQNSLKEHYNAILYRNIVERHKVSNIKLLRSYLSLLTDQVACKFSISKTAIKLQEIGHSFSKNTLANFLNYMEESYLIFTTKKYDFKIRDQLRAPKKIYAIDHGLLKAIRFEFLENPGRILENIVYLALRRKNESKDIYYYQGKQECDFLTTNKGKVTAAIQVAKNISSNDTKKREVDGLLEALNQLKLQRGFILTEDEHEIIESNDCTIEVLPIWYWLLMQ